MAPTCASPPFTSLDLGVQLWVCPVWVEKERRWGSRGMRCGGVSSWPIASRVAPSPFSPYSLPRVRSLLGALLSKHCVPILQVRKVRLREVKKLPKGPLEVSRDDPSTAPWTQSSHATRCPLQLLPFSSSCLGGGGGEVTERGWGAGLAQAGPGGPSILLGDRTIPC